MTLAEWRTALDGMEDREKADMRKRAWELSHALMAAGCDADKVTVPKLLGEEEKHSRKRWMSEEEKKKKVAERVWRNVERTRAKLASSNSEVD